MRLISTGQIDFNGSPWVVFPSARKTSLSLLHFWLQITLFLKSNSYRLGNISNIITTYTTPPSRTPDLKHQRNKNIDEKNIRPSADLVWIISVCHLDPSLHAEFQSTMCG